MAAVVNILLLSPGEKYAHFRRAASKRISFQVADAEWTQTDLNIELERCTYHQVWMGVDATAAHRTFVKDHAFGADVLLLLPDGPDADDFPKNCRFYPHTPEHIQECNRENNLDVQERGCDPLLFLFEEMMMVDRLDEDCTQKICRLLALNALSTFRVFELHKRVRPPSAEPMKPAPAEVKTLPVAGKNDERPDRLCRVGWEYGGSITIGNYTDHDAWLAAPKWEYLRIQPRKRVNIEASPEFLAHFANASTAGEWMLVSDGPNSYVTVGT
jgi:hypothetical protein